MLRPAHLLALAALAALPSCHSECDEPALERVAAAVASPDADTRVAGLTTLGEVCPGLPKTVQADLIAGQQPPDPTHTYYEGHADDPAWATLLARTCPRAPHPPERPLALSDLDPDLRSACDLDRFRLLEPDSPLRTRDLPAFMLYDWLIRGRVARTRAAEVVRPLLTASRYTAAAVTPPRSTSDVAPRDVTELRISPTAIALDGVDLVPLAGGRPAPGVVVRHIYPALQSALADLARRGNAEAERTGRPWPALLSLVVDRATPFSTLGDALYTATRAGIGDYELLVHDGDELRAQHIATPLAWLPPDDAIRCGKDLDLTYFVRPDAISVASGRPPATPALIPPPADCDPALTGCHDLAAIQADARKYKALFPMEVVATFRVADDVPLQALVALIDAVRGEGCRLTPPLRGEKVPDECLFWQVVVDTDPPLDHQSDREHRDPAAGTTSP